MPWTFNKNGFQIAGFALKTKNIENKIENCHKYMKNITENPYNKLFGIIFQNPIKKFRIFKSFSSS